MPVVTIEATEEWAVPNDRNFDPIDPARSTSRQRLTYALGHALWNIVPEVLTEHFDRPTGIESVTVRFTQRNVHDLNVIPIWITIAPMRHEELVATRFELRQLLIERVRSFFNNRLSGCENPDLSYRQKRGGFVHAESPAS